MAFVSTNPIKTLVINAVDHLLIPPSTSDRIQVLDWWIRQTVVASADMFLYFGPSFDEGYIIVQRYLYEGAKQFVSVNPDLLTGQPGEPLGFHYAGNDAPTGYIRYRLL